MVKIIWLLADQLEHKKNLSFTIFLLLAATLIIGSSLEMDHNIVIETTHAVYIEFL